MADLSDGAAEEDKYGKLYEENMNPFAQFHRREEKRRYNALNPADKLTLKMTRLMFSHRWSRYFLMVYALLLHLLVVTTLYQLSLWECRHDHEEFNLPPQIIPPP
jgi:homeobox protein cut-like